MQDSRVRKREAEGKIFAKVYPRDVSPPFIIPSGEMSAHGEHPHGPLFTVE
jgi:hypothetical protein